MKQSRTNQQFSAEVSFDIPKTKRKSWSIHDLKSVRPLTENQATSLQHYREGLNIGLLGCAGTGKTFLGAYMALHTVLSTDNPIDNIVIVRSAVQSRDQGFMPGDLQQKMREYEIPYQEVFTELLGRWSSYEDMKAAGIVRFDSTSFLRSRTINNSVIIFDECQNALFREIDTVVTRVGRDSRLILVGDTRQDDLTGVKGQKSGLIDAMKVMNRLDDFGLVEFTVDDIVRSEFAKRWIKTCYELNL